jgi:Ca-activated chloride channel homolog
MERQRNLRNLTGKLAAVAAAMTVITFFILAGGLAAFGKTGPVISPEAAVAAEGPEKGDKTLSPYFFVRSEDASTDQLPLKATWVEADIAGVIADVKVTQVYRNEGRKALEAIYIFPASTRAAVYGMKMTIGNRTITACIAKREEARAAYEQAKQEGRSASLLEQQRPNVFQMNVANILPGDEIKTELQYTELITPTAGIYEFVYPTVVGPRYSNQPANTASPAEKWSQNPYLHQNEPPPYTFHLTTRLTPGVPIQEMTCTSHKVDIRYRDPSRAVVELDAAEKSGGNRDFILRYRLAGDSIESGLLLYQGEEENFFLLSVQPPRRFVPNQVPPREYLFIVDVSGSMHGFPLDISKRLMRELLANLRPSDALNVLLFSGGSTLLAPQSLPVTPENVRQAMDVIERQQGGGGTELLPALKRALALPRRERFSRTVVIATDGYVTVEPEAFELIRRELGNANFFAFGIGSSVNRFLIEGMARAGFGEPFVITNPSQAAMMAERFREYIQSPLLTQIKLDFGAFEVYDVEPAGVPDVLAERPVTVFGKWRGKPSGKITLRGLAGERNYEKTIDVAATEPISDHAALSHLWAQTRVAQLGDDNRLQADDRRVAEITQLALRYHLLTAYTSFVAVDTQVRRMDGDVTTVTQPLPLPEGVSDYAVGNAASPVARMLSATVSPASEGMKIKGADSPSPVDKTDAKGLVVKEETSRESRDEAGARWKLSIRKITVSGGALSELSVRKIIEQHLGALKNRCLPFLTAGKPAELVVEWIVDASGGVSDLKILSPQTALDGLEMCLRAVIKTWNFPATAGKRATKVSVSLSLEADSP